MRCLLLCSLLMIATPFGVDAQDNEYPGSTEGSSGTLSAGLIPALSFVKYIDRVSEQHIYTAHRQMQLSPDVVFYAPHDIDPLTPAVIRLLLKSNGLEFVPQTLSSGLRVLVLHRTHVPLKEGGARQVNTKREYSESELKPYRLYEWEDDYRSSQPSDLDTGSGPPPIHRKHDYSVDQVIKAWAKREGGVMISVGSTASYLIPILKGSNIPDNVTDAELAEMTLEPNADPRGKLLEALDSEVLLTLLSVSRFQLEKLWLPDGRLAIVISATTKSHEVASKVRRRQPRRRVASRTPVAPNPPPLALYLKRYSADDCGDFLISLDALLVKHDQVTPWGDYDVFPVPSAKTVVFRGSRNVLEKIRLRCEQVEANQGAKASEAEEKPSETGKRASESGD